MPIVDMHCDTMYELWKNQNQNLYNGEFKVNIEKLKKGKYMLQFFATFFDITKEKSAFETANLMIEKFLGEVDINKEHIEIAKTYKDIKDNYENGKISSILTLEEGGAVEGKLENIKHFYDLGVRLIGLTWNYPNTLGCPHCEKNDSALTSFGEEAVEYMNEIGIIVDVSHLSDRGFYRVADISKKPFVASHSNSREITNHSRNLTDDMIRKIGNRGGVIGLNFASDFLGKSDIARVDDMITHLKHIKNKGGIDSLAIGSDFDGIDNEVEIKDASEMCSLEDILSSNGFNSCEIEKILYKNTLRVIKECI